MIFHPFYISQQSFVVARHPKDNAEIDAEIAEHDWFKDVIYSDEGVKKEEESSGH